MPLQINKNLKNEFKIQLKNSLNKRRQKGTTTDYLMHKIFVFSTAVTCNENDNN